MVQLTRCARRLLTNGFVHVEQIPVNFSMIASIATSHAIGFEAFARMFVARDLEAGDRTFACGSAMST